MTVFQASFLPIRFPALAQKNWVLTSVSGVYSALKWILESSNVWAYHIVQGTWKH